MSAETGHTPISGAPGYAVSKDGRVWAVGTNWRGIMEREIRPVLNGRGYLKVRLMIGGRRKNIPVHRIVARTFVGPKPSPLHEVCHRDGNAQNNAAANLYWGTRSDNARDRVRHGRTYRPDWSDKEKRERWSAAMRNGKRRAAIQKATTP